MPQALGASLDFVVTFEAVVLTLRCDQPVPESPALPSLVTAHALAGPLIHI